MIQHFIPMSGGKDSTAVACLAVERMDRRADFRPRFVTADTMNEHDGWAEHITYLEVALGITIEKVSAYSVPGLIDEEAFARKRASIRASWPNELRRKRHVEGCDKSFCDCPIVISPPVSAERIEQAVAALVPMGNAFIDMCLIHGRFPSKKAKFCTYELKLRPLDLLKAPIRAMGGTTIDWVGERAAESKAREKKPMLQRKRMSLGNEIIYRPIHKWSADDVFAIARRHGLVPNPLYLKGASRVGCWPCINCRKKEISLVSRMTPKKIDFLEHAEALVSLVSRRGAMSELQFPSFFAADKVPGDHADWTRARIRKVVEWAKTGRGGKQYDLLHAIEERQMDEDGAYCDSEYGLCE